MYHIYVDFQYTMMRIAGPEVLEAGMHSVRLSSVEMVLLSLLEAEL